MTTTQYIGEWLLPGRIGNLMIIIAVVAALFAAFYFWLSARKERNIGLKYSRAAHWIYGLHLLALASAGAILYYLIFNHRFEYQYVWKYSSLELQVRYIIACFWAGQEGSFWVWAFWQGLVGLFVMIMLRRWRPSIMAIVSIAQFFLSSMLLGIQLFGLRIGSSPFVLLRQVPENLRDGFFNNPNYLKEITDGLGLNPLLENPWMVTHPPVLFLGYALFLIPFAFALTGLWKKDYAGWIKPALPWVGSALITLGTGILLGGRWAYESLTFGGFWAWDPVENASLVPWLLMLAALHFMLLSLKRAQHYRISFILVFLAFLFVLYATFLTRSGVLAETSVHSFSADQRYQQIVVFIALFLIIPFIGLIRNWKSIPSQESKELLSRDFFLFAGSIILVLSAFQIIFATSIPVFNAVLGTNLAPPNDPVTYYNKWQLPFALMMLAFIGFTQFLTYGRNNPRAFLKMLIFPILVSVAISGLYAYTYSSRLELVLLVGVGAFAVLASLDFMLRHVKKSQNFPASTTHIGFGIFVAAIVLSFAHERIISHDALTGADNVKLLRGKPIPLSEYHVVYSNREKVVNETFFTIDFLKLKPDSTLWHEFSLRPSINRHPQMGQVSNPATRHSMFRDIYTYISHAQESDASDAEGYSLLQRTPLKLGDTMVALRSFIIFDSLVVDMPHENYQQVSIHARLLIKSMMIAPRHVWIRYHVKDDAEGYEDAIVEDLNAKLRFEGVTDKPKTIELGIYNKAEEYIILRAIIFPNIRLLWLGSFIMLFGFIYSMVRRIRQLKGNGTHKQPPSPTANPNG